MRNLHAYIKLYISNRKDAEQFNQKVNKTKEICIHFH